MTTARAAVNASGNVGVVGLFGFAERLAFGDDALYGAWGAPDPAPGPRVRAPVHVPLLGVLAFYVMISFLPLEKAAKGDVLLDDLVGAQHAYRLRAAYGRLRRFKICNYQGGDSGAVRDYRWEIVVEGLDARLSGPTP